MIHSLAVYHTNARNPSDIPGRPDDGIVHREPKIFSLQPVRPDEIRHGTSAPRPLVCVGTEKENVITLGEQAIHKGIQLFRIPFDIPVLKNSQCG
jgi:hypothetical protein